MQKKLLLKPFTLHETKIFLESNKINFTNKQILQLYTVMGGIPHYLKQVKKSMSAMQNINHLCFIENGILFSEFDKLFKSLFRDAKKYMELIRELLKFQKVCLEKRLKNKVNFSRKEGV